MAIRVETLGDMRAAAKTAEGIRAGYYKSGDPLPGGLAEMADDVVKWLNPSQGWHLMGVSTGFISPRRIAESITEASEIRFKIESQQPDSFTPSFFLQADNPPIRTGGFIRRREVVDFPQVFACDFKDRISIFDGRTAFVNFVNGGRIGQMYPLETALKVLSSPYYLVGASIHLDGNYPRQVKTSEAPGLTVMVFARDLIDYTRLEVNKFRRIQRQLDKQFSLLQPAQETSTEQ